MTYKFDPSTDMADLTGKVAIVTGGKYVRPSPHVRLANELTVTPVLASAWRP